MAAVDDLVAALGIGHNGGPPLDDEAVEKLIADLDDETIEQLLAPILADEERARFHRFEDLFPEDGPFRRELYPKHMEFFRAGKAYRERCFMAANRCITPWTYVETPEGAALSADTWTLEKPRVQALVGGSQRAVQLRHGYLVGIRPAFRLVMGNGQFVDCTGEHRVLTAEGYLSVDQLVSRSSGLRCWHRAEDFQANCDEDGYLGDRPLRSVAGIDLSPPPSQADVRGRAPLHFSLPDEAERTLRHIRAFPALDRLSTRHDLHRHAALFALLSGPSTASPVLHTSASSRAVQRLAVQLAPRLRSVVESHCDQPAGASPGDVPGQSHADPETRSLLEQAGRELERSLDATAPGWSGLSSLTETARIATFYPSEHPALWGGNSIICVVPLGFQPIIDAQVPGAHNYVAGGMVNHNCGKTVAGGFEMTCHLTGNYPDWWEGRRFTRPVRAWAAGDTNETTRDIIQLELLGTVVGVDGGRKGLDGSGLLPRDCIGQPKWKQGVQDLVDTIPILHRSGGWSVIGFKSFDQGRRAFQGTAKEVIWLDEECPLDVYNECLIRTATTRGLLLSTFTPLSGLTETVLQFLPKEMRPGEV